MKEDKANQVTGQDKEEGEQAKGRTKPRRQGLKKPATRLSNNKTKSNKPRAKQTSQANEAGV